MDEKLTRRAFNALTGGVNSPVRSLKNVNKDPLLISGGKGQYLFDVDGNKLIDYIMSFGANILGHSPPQVCKSIKNKLPQGWTFGLTHKDEIILAELIKLAIPFIDKIRFVNSGTEAVMGAIRLSRGYTRRDIIVKCDHAYHGHADYLLVKGGSGLASFNIPSSKGVPKASTKNTVSIPYGNTSILDKVFNKYADRIAAVIIEPVGGNYGVVPFDKKFLKHARQLTKKNGSLLIFDEVITGFRFHWGSFSSLVKIIPDFIVLGKIIGGGLPIGAYAAKAHIMRQLSPLGDVYQASTFAGNGLVMTAGIATLEELQKNPIGYVRSSEYSSEIVNHILDKADKSRVKVEVNRFKSMFSIKFTNTHLFEVFYKELLAQGVVFSPSPYEVNFVSHVHNKKNIEHTKKSITKAFNKLEVGSNGG